MSKENTKKNDEKPRASTAKLAPGEDTIMRSKATATQSGGVRIKWSYRPLDGSQTVRTTTQGANLSQARMRARNRLADLEAATGGSTWRPDHRLADYMEAETVPAIARAHLAKLSLDRYNIALGLLLGDCAEHTHKHSLKRHTIASGSKFKALEALLREIAEDHGRETARQCRTVLTKYVLTRLIRDQLLDGNPIAGVSLNELTGTRPGQRVRGGKALSLGDYDRVIEYLLTLDPTEGIVRRQGRWPIEVRIAKRANTIDQALFQAGTGLRASEANGTTWARHIGMQDDGTMYVNVTEDIAKGGVPRVALVLDERVKNRLLQRRARAKSENHYVLGSPHDAGVRWDRGNHTETAADLYKTMARELKIAAFENERTHVWRTTLHALYGGGSVPSAVLDLQFGNSEKIRAEHYTDASDLTALSEAVKLIRE